MKQGVEAAKKAPPLMAVLYRNVEFSSRTLHSACNPATTLSLHHFARQAEDTQAQDIT